MFHIVDIVIIIDMTCIIVADVVCIVSQANKIAKINNIAFISV